VVSESGKAVAMSYDHKPTDAAEHSRIIKVGAQKLIRKSKKENRQKVEKTPVREQNKNRLCLLALLNIDSTMSSWLLQVG
jgi:hypothetical protein